MTTTHITHLSKLADLKKQVEEKRNILRTLEARVQDRTDHVTQEYEKFLPDFLYVYGQASRLNTTYENEAEGLKIVRINTNDFTVYVDQKPVFQNNGPCIYKPGPWEDTLTTLWKTEGREKYFQMKAAEAEAELNKLQEQIAATGLDATVANIDLPDLEQPVLYDDGNLQGNWTGYDPQSQLHRIWNPRLRENIWLTRDQFVIKETPQPDPELTPRQIQLKMFASGAYHEINLDVLNDLASLNIPHRIEKVIGPNEYYYSTHYLVWVDRKVAGDMFDADTGTKPIPVKKIEEAIASTAQQENGNA